EPKIVKAVPEPGKLLPVEEHHEIGKLASIDAARSYRTHEIHPHCVAAQGEEDAMAKAEDPCEAPHELDSKSDHGEAGELAEKQDVLVFEVQRAFRRQRLIEERDDETERQSKTGENAPACPCMKSQKECQHCSVLRRPALEREKSLRTP